MNNLKAVVYTIVTFILLLASLLGSVVLFPVLIGIVSIFVIYLIYKGYLDSKQVTKRDWKEIGNEPLFYYSKNPETNKYTRKVKIDGENEEEI